MKKLPSRGDALRHRELLLDAAGAVFAQSGVHVPLELVIARAGVSRATLYRNFSDREALAKALLDRAFDQLEIAAKVFSLKDDGLFDFLSFVAQGMTTGTPLMSYWNAIDRAHPVIQDTTARFSTILRPLLRQCKAAKLCRSDLTARDLILVFTMLSGSTTNGYGQTDSKKAMARAVDLCLRGLRVRA